MPSRMQLGEEEPRHAPVVRLASTFPGVHLIGSREKSSMHKETAEQELQAVLRACLTISHEPVRRPARTSGVVSGFNKTEIDLMCSGIPNREAEVQRLSLALAVIAITPEHGAERRA